MEPELQILDVCCGGRMWWWNKNHPNAIYMDIREAPRGSIGEATGHPEWNPGWECVPDILGDFREMEFKDESFQLVVFDPPHIKAPLNNSLMHLKYGALDPDIEQDDLRRGFSECWRVLRPGGTLIVKWAGDLKRVKPHFPATPIVGTRTRHKTHWLVFFKPLPSGWISGPINA